jgi:hypothetical protein
MILLQVILMVVTKGELAIDAKVLLVPVLLVPSLLQILSSRMDVSCVVLVLVLCLLVR